MVGPKRRGGLHEYIGFFVIFFLLISTGCATKEALKKGPSEEDLRERVMSYWNLKIRGDYAKCYEFELPQNRMTMENYIKRFSNPMMMYKSFDIQEIEKPDGDVADVKMTVLPVVKVPGARAFEHGITITERWARVRGIWYHILKGTSNNLIH